MQRLIRVFHDSDREVNQHNFAAPVGSSTDHQILRLQIAVADAVRVNGSRRWESGAKRRKEEMKSTKHTLLRIENPLGLARRGNNETIQNAGPRISGAHRIARSSNESVD
jgi:hypothetical protein